MFHTIVFFRYFLSYFLINRASDTKIKSSAWYQMTTYFINLNVGTESLLKYHYFRDRPFFQQVLLDYYNDRATRCPRRGLISSSVCIGKILWKNTTFSAKYSVDIKQYVKHDNLLNMTSFFLYSFTKKEVK